MMKKKALLLSVMCVLGWALCTSCGKSAASASLTGEWDIVAISGQAVDTTIVEKVPFIGFDRTENRIYGNAGCNSFFAELQLDSVNAAVSFGHAGATRMMCPNMETENAILGTLDKIVSYKTLDNGDVDLCNEAGESMLVIRKR